MRAFPRWLAGVVVVVAIAVIAIYIQTRKGEPSDNRTVVLRLQSFALSLHPLKMADVESRQVATLLYAGLIAAELDGKTRPMLASTWTKSGNEWEFIVKKNMTFANGAPVTPADVVASLCAAMQPNSPWAWSLLSITHKNSVDGKSRECTGISAVDDDRVKIVETKPVPWFLDAIGGPPGWILPAKDAKEQAYGVMPGAGPYVVKEIVPDVKVVLEARQTGSAISPGVKTVRFDYLPDDSVAAKQYANKDLDVLDLTTPQLVALLTDPSSRKLKYPGAIIEKPWDRIRVVIVNEKSLSAKGFTPEQIRDFIDALSAAVDRKKLAAASRGTGETLTAAFPPARTVPEATRLRRPEPLSLPQAKVSIITESDPYSDLIAATLPKAVGSVSLDYKGVDKGILLSSLFKGEFDIISMVIEATAHSAEFWKAFFTPGNPYSVAGKPLPGMESVDVSSDAGIAQAGRAIVESGNWIPLLQEKRVQAIAPGVSDVAYSPSGQTNFAFIKKN